MRNVNLKQRLLNEEFSAQQVDVLVEHLNNARNKGTILKRYGLLEKGERWNREDLDSFLESFDYKRLDIDNSLYRYELIETPEPEETSKLKPGDFFELQQKYRVGDKITKLYNVKHRLCESIGKDPKGILIDINDKSIVPLGQYVKTVNFKNRRELLNKFKQVLPFTANKLIQIEYYKLPDFKKLYNSNKTYSSIKSYEHDHRYGERRVMKGSFVLDGFAFKERDGYLLMKDIEDDNIEKPIIIRNMISFIFNGIKYCINE